MLFKTVKLKTALYDTHLKLKANIVDFHGWQMPISYTGIVEEHLHTRKASTLFDLSHMGRIVVKGNDCTRFLQGLLTTDIEKLLEGQAKYCMILNSKGGIIDDLVLYKDANLYLLVVNASNRENVLAHMKSFSGNIAVEIVDKTMELSMIALQGPDSEKVMKDSLSLELNKLKYYRFRNVTIMGEDAVVSRTGYTGEDGFEIMAPKKITVSIWSKLLSSNVTKVIPAGLGARDTLRTEAGMALYGNDIDETFNPIEAGLSFAVSLDKTDFVGKSSIANVKPTRRLTGFTMTSKRIARHGHEIFDKDRKMGFVTSGTFSPTFQKAIGMCYVEPEQAKPNNTLTVDIRGKREEIVIQELPFYRRKK